MGFLIFLAILGGSLLIGYNIKVVGDKIVKAQKGDSNKNKKDYINQQLQELREDIKKEVKEEIKEEIKQK